MASATAPSPRWLYGPAPDLLLGCGLWYAAAFVLLTFFGAEVRTGGGLVVLPLVTLLASTPHYGATLVRVYSRREDRRAYTLFAVHASLLLAALFVTGVYSLVIGSWILTVYITWSPWHYTGQNYGIAVMFLRRRGVPLDASFKRWLYASFILSYALTFLALHAGAQASSYVPLAYEADTYRFQSLRFDPAWSRPLFVAVALAYLAAVTTTVVGLLRRASLRDVAPSLALMGTQALWFSVPLLLRQWNVETGIEPLESSAGAYYFLWIALGHAVQYLWITSYYARGGASGRAGPRYFAAALCAGAAVWCIPALLFAPDALGRLPFDAGLAILVASIVNLHHFVLDGAIWKLRDGRVARILLRARHTATESTLDAGGRPTALASGAMWLAGGACVLILFGARIDTDVLLRRAASARDVSAVADSLDRLARVGRDSARRRLTLGRALEQQGDSRGAMAAYRRSLELQPRGETWFLVASIQARGGLWEPALASLDAARRLAPDLELVHYERGAVLLELDRPAEARAAFARAAELNPERGINRTLEARAAALATEKTP